LQVGPQTPPTFLFHTREDQAVVLKNSELYAEALKKARVDHELLIYEKGRHGVGLGGKDSVLSQWPVKLAAWLQARGFAPQ
ncbi:MAG: alpha/beta hydrolase, partial [Gemmataceae bacterium]